jgi:hypothetical protein
LIYQSNEKNRFMNSNTTAAIEKLALVYNTSVSQIIELKSGYRVIMANNDQFAIYYHGAIYLVENSKLSYLGQA